MKLQQLHERIDPFAHSSASSFAAAKDSAMQLGEERWLEKGTHSRKPPTKPELPHAAAHTHAPCCYHYGPTK